MHDYIVLDPLISSAVPSEHGEGAGTREVHPEGMCLQLAKLKSRNEVYSMLLPWTLECHGPEVVATVNRVGTKFGGNVPILLQQVELVIAILDGDDSTIVACDIPQVFDVS